MNEPVDSSGWKQRIVAELFRPVDLASRVAFRIAFSGIMLWEFWRFRHHGWIPRYWIEPEMNFKYFGFGWVQAWPGDGMYVHFVVMAVLAAMILTGLFYRVATTLFFFAFTFVFLLEQARYLNHFYLVCIVALLLIFVPANRLFSLDARLFPSLRAQTAPAWSLWLLRFQLGVVYFYGGIAKLNHDWLRGEPIGHWIDHLGDTPLIGPIFVQSWSGLLFAYGGLFIDLGVAPLLLWRRTRVLGFGMVLFFNMMNAFMFNIGIFPWMMIAASTIFFEPDWPRRLLIRLRIALPEDSDRVSVPVETWTPPPLTTPRRGLLVALAIFAAFQLLFPFRHWLYPGSVHWTEEGHRFAWHMKLRDKEAECWFEAVDPRSDEVWDIYPEDVLGSWQERKMCTRPDMILQFAHWSGNQLRSEGVSDVRIYAHTFASLHGRPFQALIDPEVDLMQVRRDLWPADWIVPMQDAPMGDF